MTSVTQNLETNFLGFYRIIHSLYLLLVQNFHEYFDTNNIYTYIEHVGM